MTKRLLKKFQFHAGLIKRSNNPLWLDGQRWFQFHAGLIKSYEQATSMGKAIYRFNSMLVWLKELVKFTIYCIN